MEGGQAEMPGLIEATLNVSIHSPDSIKVRPVQIVSV